MKKIKQLRHRLYDFLQCRQTRLCFLATAIFGTLSYLYLFVNNINNNDMIVCLPEGYGSGITSGRWGLYLLGELTRKVWGVFNVPVFNGVLALILLAFTSAVLVRVLELESTWLCFSLAAITATFAPIGAMMFFQFTVHYYSFAILLMALAAYLLKKRHWAAFLGGCLLAACSLGIYQAYFPFLAAVLLLTLLGICLKHESTGKEILLDALRTLAALILSYVFYQLILKGFLAALHTSLSNYQGIDQMGSLKDFPQQLYRTYLSFFELPFVEFCGVNATRFVRVAMLVLGVFSVLSLILFWRERKVGKILLGCVFVLLLPAAANAITLLSGNSVLYTRMCFGLIAVFYLPMLLLQRLSFRKPLWKKIALAFAALIILSSAANYAWQSNGNYQAVYYANRKAENYFTTMFTRIRSLEGYRDDMDIVLVGQTITDEKFYDNYYVTPFHYGARTGATGQINEYSRLSFLANYHGISIRYANEFELVRYADVFSAMSSYPDSGCMQIIDNTVFVVLEYPVS